MNRLTDVPTGIWTPWDLIMCFLHQRESMKPSFRDRRIQTFFCKYIYTSYPGMGSSGATVAALQAAIAFSVAVAVTKLLSDFRVA